MNGNEIQTIAMEEIWKANVEGYLPVLLEIFNPDLKWDDNSLEQENMYLRVICDTNPVIYKTKKYLPCEFLYTPPSEDGKKIGTASITLSAIDDRVVQMLRSIDMQCEITVVAGFAKYNGRYAFFPLENFKAKLPSASYSRATATLSLSFKDVLQLNVPRDTATKDRLPSVNANA